MGNGRKRIAIVQTLKNQRVIADKCIVAECFWDRFMGLMGRRELSSGEGIFFPRCNSLHTWFMKIPIDVIFLKPTKGSKKDHYQVMSVYSNVKPWKLLPLTSFKASEALELDQGMIHAFGIEVGDVVCISSPS